MAAATLTPRVRTMAICDDVLSSEVESEVFTLEGVRQYLRITTVPWTCRLCVFLLLSSTRKGTYRSKVTVKDDSTRDGKVIRYRRYSVTFHEDNEIRPLFVEIDDLTFPQHGGYFFEVWFTDKDGVEVLKGELPFQVL